MNGVGTVGNSQRSRVRVESGKKGILANALGPVDLNRPINDSLSHRGGNDFDHGNLDEKKFGDGIARDADSTSRLASFVPYLSIR